MSEREQQVQAFTARPTGAGATIITVEGKPVPDGMLYTPDAAVDEFEGISKKSMAALDALLKWSAFGRRDGER